MIRISSELNGHFTSIRREEHVELNFTKINYTKIRNYDYWRNLQTKEYRDIIEDDHLIGLKEEFDVEAE